MKISVERHVKQVRDGSHYKGYVKIANTTLDYELVFGIPIPTLASMEPAIDEEGVRRLFQIIVKRNNADIDLTKDEYGFFFSMIVELAVEFYNNPQTRDNQEGMMGLLLSGNSPMSEFASVSIGMTSNGLYDLPPEICEMLSTPKFGCVLVT